MIARIDFISVPPDNEPESFVIVADGRRSPPFGAGAETPFQLADQAVLAQQFCRRTGATTIRVRAHVGPVWLEGPPGCAIVTAETP